MYKEVRSAMWIVFMGLIFVSLSIFYLSMADTANAAVSGTGPHNENGNTTMDYYWTDNFHGSMGQVIRDFNNTPRPGNMPQARRVYSIEEADVWVYRDEDASPAWFSHREGAVDRIGINPKVDGGITGTKVYTHETAHSYSFQHMDATQCEAARGGSVMCKRFWNPHHLTLTDNMYLRHLPNTFQGIDAREGNDIAG